VARILIDALGADSPGARRHLEGLLPALERNAGGHRFRLVVRKSAAREIDLPADGPVELWPMANGLSQPVLLRLLIDLVYLPLHARRQAFDAIVTLANFGPVWTPVPHIVFQRNALHFSEEFFGRIGGLSHLNWRLRGWLTVAEMRWATLTVTPTDAMAELIKTRHPSLAGGRFHTLPHGTDLSRFTAVESGGSAEPVEPPGRFVFLYPTKPEVYKGLEILLEATRHLSATRDDFEVRVTTDDRGWPGEIQDRIDAARGQAWFSRLSFIGPQPAERMPEVYRETDAVVYPSLCESFGFPLLESMACGLPIVAGDMDVNRELCRDAAEYYPIQSSEVCAAAMHKLLSDSQRRAELRSASRRRIADQDWSWEAYARSFVALCESVSSGR
jgi:glycosyltransferase involved in cell wall biosynthesis